MDDDCADGRICEGNGCIDGCRRDDDCLPGFECLNSACEAVGPECREDGDCPGDLVCIDETCVPEPICRNADQITEVDENGGDFQVDTNNRPSAYSGSCAGAGNEQIYRFTLNEGAGVVITTDASGRGTDPVLYMRRQCDDPGSEVACNDDFGGLNSQLSFDLLDAGVYFVFADTFNARPATYGMSVEVTPIECDNDDQCDGIAVCEAGRCVPPDCLRDDQCDRSQRCLDGRCVEREDFCERDTDCPGAPEEICEAETCISANGGCADRDECAPDDYCVSGTCTAPIECDNNRTCRQVAFILRCVDGFCAGPINQCEDNSDCNAGNSCVFGICAPFDTPECVRDSSCDDDEICEEQSCVDL
jgi:hypothetical protein